MRLFTNGVKLPKLGSVQDRVLRKFMTKESELESKKMQFTALMAVHALPEKDDRVKKLWKDYLGLTYGVEIPEISENESLMIKFYDEVVSKMKPKLENKDGKAIIHGIGFLAKESETKASK